MFEQGRWRVLANETKHRIKSHSLNSPLILEYILLIILSGRSSCWGIPFYSRRVKTVNKNCLRLLRIWVLRPVERQRRCQHLTELARLVYKHWACIKPGHSKCLPVWNIYLIQAGVILILKLKYELPKPKTSPIHINLRGPWPNISLEWVLIRNRNKISIKVYILNYWHTDKAPVRMRWGELTFQVRQWRKSECESGAPISSAKNFKQYYYSWGTIA